MKALSVKNPWAWLIVKGYKDVENRTRRTSYRGRILIHISKQFDWTIRCYPSLNGYALEFDACNAHDLSQAIIGEVTIVDCVEGYKSKWAEPNCWNWVLSDPVLYAEPILNIKGRLGLWEYSKEIKQ